MEIKTRCFCVSTYWDWPYWFSVIQIGWRQWRWWELLVANDHVRVAHLNIRKIMNG